jgi:excisionase family DNA binding protein
MARTSTVTRTAPREYADVTTTAARYRMHPDTLRQMAREGRVPYYRLGRAFRFDLEELDALFRHDATRDLDDVVTPPGRRPRVAAPRESPPAE